jgi:hypothetical protein
MVRETAREAHMFRFEKPETSRAALLLFLGNETGAKSGFVSYVSFFLGFDFDPNCNGQETTTTPCSVNCGACSRLPADGFLTLAEGKEDC